MKKRFLSILLFLLCLGGGLFFLQDSWAQAPLEVSEPEVNYRTNKPLTGQELQLPEKDTLNLLQACQQVLIDKWIDLTVSPSFAEPEKQAALFLIRNAIQRKEFFYWLTEPPKDYLKAVIEMGASLATAEKPIADIIGKIEKETVKKAVDIATDWLLQNEIRVGQGKLSYSFSSYKGNVQKPPLHYLVVSTGNEKAIEFYSPEPVEPPKATGVLLGLGIASWEFQDWRKAGNEVLPPFIIRIKGKAAKDNALGYKWQENLLEIRFPESVPHFAQEKYAWLAKIPFLGKYYQEIKQRFAELKLILGRAKEMRQDIQRLGSGALVVPETMVQEQEKQDLVVLEPDKLPRPTPDVSSELGLGGPLPREEILAQIQEELDDIAEEIDVIDQETAELTGQSVQSLEQEVGQQEEVGQVEEAEAGEQEPSVQTRQDVPSSGGIEPGPPACETCGGEPEPQQETSPPPSFGGPPSPSLPPPPLVKLLISEVQIRDASSSDNDFIELYNPNNNDLDISGFQLKKKSSSGKEYSVRLLSNPSKIPALGYFLWLNTEYASSSQISANTFSTQTLAKNNSLALFDKYDRVIDAVAWATSTNPFVETIPFADNPAENESLGRKWATTTQTYQDSNNNQQDFELQEPTPGAQNKAKVAPAPPGPPPPLPPAPPQPPPTPQATSTRSVVINEIAWMGTKANAQDEWIELYNNTSSSIDLTGWTLKAEDDSPDITFPTSTIPAQGYYLLERTDDQTISNIPADLIYTGDLHNNGEKLQLKDAQGILVDQVDCSQAWFAGQASPGYISMERINSQATGTDPANWHSNNLISRNGLTAEKQGQKYYINGTPKQENSVSKSETQIPAPSVLPFNEFDQLTFTFLGSPYIIGNTLNVPQNKTLNIEPGVTVKFAPSWGATIQGTLKAIGQENEKIIFTSNNKPQYWAGLYFEPSSTSSEINWTNIQYAQRGTSGGPPAILVEDSSIILANSIVEKYTCQDCRGLKLINSSSTIENSQFLGASTSPPNIGIEVRGGEPSIKNSQISNNKHGIFITQGASPWLEANEFTDNQVPVYITYNSAKFPVFIDNYGSNNQTQGISIRGIIGQDAAWHKNSLPYLIPDFVEVLEGTTLTIKPGVAVKFEPNASLNIKGTLLSQGTSQERIEFTKFSSGYWKRLYFSPSSTDSILQNTVISYGGAGYGFGSGGSVYVDESSIQFHNSTSTHSNGAGLFLVNSSSTLSNSHFSHSQGKGSNYGSLEIYGSYRFPALGPGLAFDNNSQYDIFIKDKAWCGLLPMYLASTTNNCYE